jgi:hypothetical protein
LIFSTLVMTISTSCDSSSTVTAQLQHQHWLYQCWPSTRKFQMEIFSYHNLKKNLCSFPRFSLVCTYTLSKQKVSLVLKAPPF